MDASASTQDELRARIQELEARLAERDARVEPAARELAEMMTRERTRTAAVATDVGIALTLGQSERGMLRMCTDALVRHLDAAFARVWTLEGNELHLQASSGLYTHIDGGHARIEVGQFKIGRIAQERLPHLTNDVQNDPRVGDQAWARREGMVSFAGYPLIIDDDLLGVMAMFARHPLESYVIDALASVANGIALGIQRKRSELALRTSEARKAAVLETSLDCILTIDAHSRIVEFNQAAEQTFGYKAAEVLGKPMPDLIMPPDLRERHYRGMRSYLEEGKTVVIGRRIEIRGLRRDGTEFPVELAVNRIPVENTAMFTATLRDITERKQAEQDLRAAKEAAEAASKAKSQFLANMSHELRTPLNAIIGYSEMVQEEAQSLGATSLVADLGKIHGAGRHLLALISDILDLAKIEAGKMDLYVESFDTEAMLRNVAETVQPMAAKNGNRLSLGVEGGIGQMSADLTKVRQSLLNLLSNAAKFTNGGRIELRARAADEDGEPWVEFTVDDSGIGMNAEQIKQLFRPFSQLDQGAARVQSGTGLGLAISRHFCQMMGGDISVESEPGLGSRFTIRLPRNVRASERDEPEEDVDGTARGGDGPKSIAKSIVLVIDDDAEARDLMKRYLTGQGMQAVLARSGEIGLQMARKLRPCLITLDVMMPGMDGWAVLQALKSDPALASIPVIITSVVSDRGLGFALGAAEYLIKPVERERLAEVLERFRCDGSPCDVLLVEDDESSRTMMGTMLEREGWRVESAGDGVQALARLESFFPHLVILDLMMPNMDGFEFADALRKKEAWRSIPVVVLTAKDLTAQDRARLNGNVERILFKGAMSREELSRELHEFVARFVRQ